MGELEGCFEFVLLQCIISEDLCNDGLQRLWMTFIFMN